MRNVFKFFEIKAFSVAPMINKFFVVVSFSRGKYSPRLFLNLLFKFINIKMFSVFKTEQEVLQKLQDLIETIANESIGSRGKFFIGFSGIIFCNLTLNFTKLLHSLLRRIIGKIFMWNSTQYKDWLEKMDCILLWWTGCYRGLPGFNIWVINGFIYKFMSTHHVLIVDSTRLTWFR